LLVSQQADVCEEKRRLILAFDKAADALSKIVSDLRRKIHVEPVFVDGGIEIAIQRAHHARAELDRHVKEHHC